MFFNQLDKLCRQNGTTPTALITSMGMGNSNVTRWKNGTMPNSEVVIKLANYFKVTTDFLLLGVENLPPTLRGDEKRLLRLYNEMDGSGRRLAMVELFRILQKRKEDAEWWETHEDTVVKLMEQSFGEDWNKMPPAGTGAGSAIPWEDTQDDFERDEAPYPVFRSLPRYDIGASAGKGSFLDSDTYKLIDVPVDKIPLQTTFCVSVIGDSMSPDYEDGDVLFVKQQPAVEDGDLGIFLLNGSAFFKKQGRNGEKAFFYSLNPEYAPLPIKEFDEVRTIGKVLGKYEGVNIRKEERPEPPQYMKDFVKRFDEDARRLNEGTMPESDDDFDVVKPGDPEYDMQIPWAASGGAHLDEEKNKRMQEGLRLFEKRSRLANEGSKPKKKAKDGE